MYEGRQQTTTIGLLRDASGKSVSLTCGTPAADSSHQCITSFMWKRLFLAGGSIAVHQRITASCYQILLVRRAEYGRNLSQNAPSLWLEFSVPKKSVHVGGVIQA